MSEVKLDSENGSCAYIFDEELARCTSLIPNLGNRSTVVHSLIESYGLLKRLRILPSELASDADILSFHSESYLEFLSKDHDPEDDPRIEQEEKEEFGLDHDCPVFNDMLGFAKRIAGGTVTAAKALLNGDQYAINWCGGWHHAQRDSASGFCYVNDIVIGIMKLLTKFKRILYVDIDAHHGDGVENAFSFTKKVFTLSFHGYSAGYFPGTGSVFDVGFGQGRYHAANVPLLDGIDDDTYFDVFNRVLELVQAKFDAEAIVLQCGADCLSGDPLGYFKLTNLCLGKCVKRVMEFGIPVMFLGGGGYNVANTARCWTYLTSIISKTEISTEIPEHEFFLLYGPGFDRDVSPSLRRNENTSIYLSTVIKHIEENISRI